MLQVFQAVDANLDGQLSLLEIGRNFEHLWNIKISKGEINRVSKSLEVRFDKALTYTDFLVACCNKSALLTEPNLKEAFKILDSDTKDDFITRQDLKAFLNTTNEYLIGNLIEDADDDIDGGLHFKEFCGVMAKLLRPHD